jgi:hypothetical protein
MRLKTRVRSSSVLLVAGAIVLALVPSAVLAQSSTRPREQRRPVLGEQYRVEVGTTWWNPSVFGVISSQDLEVIGSQIDFNTDLGYEQTRFRDLRFVVRPGRKHRLRAQYTPIEYTASTMFTRDITFQGTTFPVSVPIESSFTWSVWRVGYEYDFLYRERGFLGVLGEARFIDMTAELTSAFANELMNAKAVVPAVGIVGRAYVLPDVAINFEVSGFKVPQIDGKYSGNYVDWDLNGTVNITNNLGAQVGWRKASTFLTIDTDTGNLKFKGMWFGVVLRY